MNRAQKDIIIDDSDPVLPIVTSKWIRRFLFLGTGTSGQVPALGCLLHKPKNTNPRCAACFDAVRLESRNRRGCTSAAVIGKGEDGEDSLILIDCGPSLYNSILRHFQAQKLGRIDGILLTHAHADAILGLDSLRSWTMGGVVQSRVDVYLTQECFKTVESMFPYLVDQSRSTGGGGVGDVKFHIIDAQAPFQVSLLGGGSISVIPLPVHHGNVHGKPFECLGFRIDTLSYVSDCHFIPASTAKLMAGSQVITIDALNPYRHASHFSLSQALSFTLSMPGLAPRLALLTDITHNLEHYQTERDLQVWRNEMQFWRDKIDNKNIDDVSIDNVGKGEAGGARWWAGKWDERKAEQRVKGNHHPSALLQSLVDDKHTSISISNDTSTEKMPLPQIHLAYDGLLVSFSPTST